MQIRGPVTLQENDKYLYGNERQPETTTLLDSDDDGIPDFDEGLYTNVVASEVGGWFSNRSSFSCPRVKPDLHTGDTVATLSPEDIEIVAAMGGSLAAGQGLWDPWFIEFRGASFAIGGDSNFDGLVTIPNILLQFNDRLQGVSHGMGTVDQLPHYQFNMAESKATTRDMPQQAKELVSRLQGQMPYKVLAKRWVLLIMQVGTEEMCSCQAPSSSDLRHAIGILRKGIPRCLVVVVGPIHVASSYSQNVNILRGESCQCLQDVTKSEYVQLTRDWHDMLHAVEAREINNLHYPTFGVYAMTQLDIHSRDPQSLIVPGHPLLNRKGHSYAAKYVWNRLMAGPKFDTDKLVFSEDSYFCPSVGCPYFRTPLNFNSCTIQTEFEYQQYLANTPSPSTPRPTRVETMQRNLGTIIVSVTALSICSVSILGTIFYCHGLRATKGRFENVQGV
ncbi:unnamed protein product, partial [Mesorhabditis spiculigera]